MEAAKTAAAAVAAAGPGSSGRRARGEVGWGDHAEGGWAWSAELHGEASELKDLDLGEVRGGTEEVRRFRYHDAYCGIGGIAEGFKYGGGACAGAFDGDARARKIYEQRTGVSAKGKWGSFAAKELGAAEVLVSAPPCQDVLRYRGAEDDRQLLAQLELVKEYRYKVTVTELTLHAMRMGNGRVFREFVSRHQQLGYRMHRKMLFGPDFGSVAARRRVYVVGVRDDEYARAGTFAFPIGRSRAHPVRSILEPEFFRRGVRVSRRNLRLKEAPEQRSKRCLIRLGVMNGKGPGRDVYSIEGSASAQLATGSGPGWTSGLYLVGGTPTRLTVREVARSLQISDKTEMDEVAAVAMWQLGNTTPVGVARALAMAVGSYLARAEQGSAATTVGGGSEGARHWALTQEGRALAHAFHGVRMVSRQARASAEAAAVRAARAGECWRWEELAKEEKEVVRRGVRRLHQSVWLRQERKRGEAAVRKLAAGGATDALLAKARSKLYLALRRERERDGEEEAPIHLLWYNWSGPVPEELVVGYKLPLRRLPAPVFPDNYDTADVGKVWEEFRRMKERGYLEGPYEEAGRKIYMTHPMAAVAKKNSEKLRIVVDLSATGLNDCLIAQRFILPQIDDVVAMSYRGCWYMTCDLQDGFYAVEVADDMRRFLGLKHPRTGAFYRYARLVMGASCAPAAFCRLVAWAVWLVKQEPEFKVVRVVVNDTDPEMPRVYGVNARGEPVVNMDWFVDDGILVGPTRQAVWRAYQRLMWVLESRLGWRISRKKTQGPAQRIEFTGLVVDSVGDDVGGPCVRLTEERRERCLRNVEAFVAKYAWRARVPRRETASLIGELSFASNAIPAGRCFLSRMYDCVHETQEEAGQKGEREDYDRTVPLRTEAKLDLRWWVQCLAEAQCVRLWRSRTFALHRCFSDASNYGFAEGIAVEETEDTPRMRFTHGVWPEVVAGYSSNWHELATIVHSISSRAQEIRNSSVHFMTDNATSVRAVNTGTVHSRQLMKLSRELKLVQARYNIGVEAIHLSGELMQVHGTDQASRAMPYVGMYSGTERHGHDRFDPMEWPLFRLNGAVLEAVQSLVTAETQDWSEPQSWCSGDAAGRDTYMHLRPAYVAEGIALLLDAQLREGATTSFTVVAPMVGLRRWRKYLKHFRRREEHRMRVEGLGEVKHWVLRFEAGDALLPRGRSEEEEEEGEDDESGEEREWNEWHERSE